VIRAFLARCWRWLTVDDKPMTLSKYWLSDTARLAAYSDWTQRENESWIVSKDTRQTRHEAFWASLEAKKQPPANVTTFQRKVR
jgi:hypothetical protein